MGEAIFHDLASKKGVREQVNALILDFVHIPSPKFILNKSLIIIT